MKSKNKFSKAASLFLAAALAVTPVLTSNLTAAFADGEDNNAKFGLYYSSDYSDRAELKKASSSLLKEITNEGVVMLKNEDNAVPLADGAKISVFGKNSVKGSVFSKSQYESCGLNVNPELVKFYNDNSRSGSGTASLKSGNYTISGLPTGETPVSSYDSAVTSSYSEYNDAAIVFFFREGGEGKDLPRTMLWDGKDYQISKNSTQPVNGARSGDDHYLQLDQNETDLLKHVNDNFSKIIVVMVSGAQMETGFLDDPNHYAYQPNIKAAFWSGDNNGEYLALPRILRGEVNPSAKTVDTWYRNFKSDPVWQNFGNQLSYDGNFFTNSSGNYTKAFTIYQEGIYMGYRYYETRGYEEAANGNPDWYDKNVVYPFGYGLSYTTFTQEIVESAPADGKITKDGKITVKVKVTNTGSVAGKDVVQLYYTSPYTTGGIEKAHVVLGDFNKTKLLAPGESEELTVSFKAKDMASYDWNDKNGNGFQGYELEKGQYIVRLMKNSHEEIANVKFNLAEDLRYHTTSDETTTSDNIFDKVSNFLIDEVKKDYMSRADFEGTFPTQIVRLEAPQWVINGMNEWNNRSGSLDNDMPYYTDKKPTTGANNGIMLKDLFGLDYDDEKWDLFLDQLTDDELKRIPSQGRYWSGLDIPRLGITKEVNTDGIAGLFYYANIHHDKTGAVANQMWGSQLLLAASFNKDLAYEKGRIIGNEGLWGGEKEYSKIAGYYAPGVNIARSPFAGRNKQYFGEDPYLSGMLAAQIVKGAQDKGMFCYVKHFGLNEQETNRLGTTTWANEQSIREIYFRSFEITVKEGKTRAIMSSLNRIGYEWAGGCYGLLTQLLRKEWGFNGNVVTDSYIQGMSNVDQMVRAGGTLALGTPSISYNANTATTYSVLREACHGLLYAHANSMAINATARPVLPNKIMQFKGATLVTGSIDADYTASVATAVLDDIYEDLKAEDIVYTLADESNPLPAGLTLAPDGTISGVPTEKVENYKITVKATIDGDYRTTDFKLNITASKPQILYSPADTVLKAGVKGEAYSASVAFAEISAPEMTEEEKKNLPAVTYGLKNGCVLPTGLELSKEGVISGTPAYACYDYEVNVIALADGMVSKAVKFTLTINENFQGKTLENGKSGESYAQSVAAGGSATYVLKEGSSLPAGLTLTPGGYIVGKPNDAVNEHKFTVIRTAKEGGEAEAEFTLSVGLNFGNAVYLPDGKKGEEYDAMINTAQGSADVKYSIVKGSLPAGLTLSEDGEITGSPKKAGVYTLTFAAEAEGLIGDEVTLTLYVAGSDADGDSGCNGSVGAAAVAVPTILALAYTALRKKKD